MAPSVSGCAGARRSAKRQTGRRFPLPARDDSGTALVEFALVVPLFAMMLFGVVQFGLVFAGLSQLRNAVQTGARMAAIGQVDQTVSPLCPEAASAPVPDQQVICQVVKLIGQPLSTSGVPVIALATNPNANTITVCARMAAQPFSGLFPSMNISSNSQFVIEDDSGLVPYAPPDGPACQ